MIIENLSTGTMGSLKMGFDSVHDTNPRLVMVAVSVGLKGSLVGLDWLRPEYPADLGVVCPLGLRG